MSKKEQSNWSGLVYSTNKELMGRDDHEEQEILPPAKQKLKVRTDSKQRAGKLVTLIDGFMGRELDMEALGKLLKTKCGTGGSVKDGLIIIQGDYKEKVTIMLKELGYGTVK